MIIRKAKEKDIPRIIELLGQVDVYKRQVSDGDAILAEPEDYMTLR